MPDAADLTRIVETKFMLKDELSTKLGSIESGLKKLNEEARETKEKTAELGEKFSQMGERVDGAREKLVGLAASFGVALGGAELARTLIEVNTEAERLQRTMGALVSANYQYGRLDPAANFRRSMATGREMYEEFQSAAMKFGLSTGQLAEAAGMLMPAFARAKIGTHEASEEVVKLGRLAQLSGRDMASTSQALDIFLMSGMAQQRNPIFAMLGITQMPEGKFSAKQRFEALEHALTRFNVDSMRGVVTMDDRVNMLKARLERIYELGGKPFFEVAEQEAEKLADWMDKNKDEVQSLVREGGEFFGTVLKTGAEALKFAAEHAHELEAVLINLVMLPKVMSFFDKVGSVADKFGLIGRGSAEAAEEATSIGQNIGIGAKAALVAGAFEIGWAIGTQIGDYLDKHTDLFKPKKSVEEINADRAEQRVQAFDKYRDTELREELENRKKYMGAKTDREALGILLHQLSGGKLLSLGRYDGREANASSEFVLMWARQHGIIPQIHARAAHSGLDTEHAKNQRGDVVFNNARFDIRQEFSQGFDPDRIAVALTNGIAKLGERKLQSAFTPIYGVR